jgi:hypothetical protein
MSHQTTSNVGKQGPLLLLFSVQADTFEYAADVPHTATAASRLAAAWQAGCCLAGWLSAHFSMTGICTRMMSLWLPPCT